MEILGPGHREHALEAMVTAIGLEMGEPPHIIAAGAFFDMVLGTCWSSEEQGGRDLSGHVERCGFLLEGYRRMRAAARAG